MAADRATAEAGRLGSAIIAALPDIVNETNELDQLTDHEPPATRTSREEGTGEQESGSEAGSGCIHVFILTTRYA